MEKYLSNIERLYTQSNDDRATIPQTEQDFRPNTIKRLEHMTIKQGLVDNTLDFVPLSKLRSTVKLVNDSSIRTARALEISDIVGVPVKDALVDTHRNLGIKVMNEILGTSKKLRKSPTYREVENYKDITSSGINFGGKTGAVDNIYVAKSKNGVKVPKELRDSTKKHEYNHTFWAKKYGNRASKKVTWDARNFNPNSSYNDAGYYATPWEVNARARQMQDLIIKNNKRKLKDDEINLLMYLKKSTAPYLKSFKEKYPNEVGAKVYDLIK